MPEKDFLYTLLLLLLPMQPCYFAASLLYPQDALLLRGLPAKQRLQSITLLLLPCYLAAF
jgi:hypothetical protein